MKQNILYLIVLIFCFSVNAFAQDKPVWIASVENTIKQKEKLWKIERKIEWGETGSYSYSFTMKSGEYRSNIQINSMQISNVEETFEGLISSFDNTMGKNKKKTKLENFGDEGFIWATNRDGWTMMMFRKGNIFVDVYAPSEKTAR